MEPDNEPLAINDIVIIVGGCPCGAGDDVLHSITSVVKIDTLSSGNYKLWACVICGKEYHDPVIYEVGIKKTINGKTGYIGRFRHQLRKIKPKPVDINTEKRNELHV